ncbi:MAG: RnfABCDGE type electron transport complex subunit D [Candidatus Egerieousia sp.]|nr:RnfABCDGE type electron transport complex subunit D [Bacteroidales bacterium]MCI6917675.1 RnfABCDGE type electron transport complex subunit D [bacterium]MDY2650477.1 RnfABCDGE type electron transport complex subunit D [Candidatus Egerieousia sp.]MDD5963079.1 RnfABCDGE type electron transport complex subunit D [bacterium]MDD7072206.1 RnfABCDGE type electron transport complex subunit D [bacterium]
MMEKLLVSPSPHIHGKDTTAKLMRDVLIALLPVTAVSIWFYGLSAIKLVVVGVLSCILVEYLIEKFLLKSKITICDCSAAVTGLLLALNLPAAAPWWVIVIGSIVAIGIAKMTFGGLGQNLFNPALVGRVFLLVSFPAIMASWTAPAPWGGEVDAFTGATPLGLIKEGLMSGKTVQEIIAANPNLSTGQLLFARAGGSAGEISVVALLLGFAWLLIRKVIKPTIPVTILVTVALFSGILWLCNPAQFTDPIFNLCTGGVMLGAIFMATDYVTSPMSTKGMIIFGVGIGILTVLIRQFGSYPEGVSFAILIMNATVPLINMYCLPKRFGRVK